MSNNSNGLRATDWAIVINNQAAAFAKQTVVTNIAGTLLRIRYSIDKVNAENVSREEAICMRWVCESEKKL